MDFLSFSTSYTSLKSSWLKFPTGIIKLANTDSMRCYYLLLQENLSPGEKTVHLSFSKKQRKCEFGALIWRQLWRSIPRYNRYRPVRNNNRVIAKPYSCHLTTYDVVYKSRMYNLTILNVYCLFVIAFLSLWSQFFLLPA